MRSKKALRDSAAVAKSHPTTAALTYTNTKTMTKTGANSQKESVLILDNPCLVGGLEGWHKRAAQSLLSTVSVSAHSQAQSLTQLAPEKSKIG